MAFNKKEYDLRYQKEHQVQLNIKLKPEEKAAIDKFLKEHNIAQKELLLYGLKMYEEKISKKE